MPRKRKGSVIEAATPALASTLGMKVGALAYLIINIIIDIMLITWFYPYTIEFLFTGFNQYFFTALFAVFIIAKTALVPILYTTQHTGQISIKGKAIMWFLANVFLDYLILEVGFTQIMDTLYDNATNVTIFKALIILFIIIKTGFITIMLLVSDNE